MLEWVAVLLVLEGLPLLGFVYYLEHKRKMYLVEKGIEVAPVSRNPEKVRDGRLVKGLFLVLAGVGLILAPPLAKSLGIEAPTTFEMLVIGLLVISAGLALIISQQVLPFLAAGGKDREDLFDYK